MTNKATVSHWLAAWETVAGNRWGALHVREYPDPNGPPRELSADERREQAESHEQLTDIDTLRKAIGTGDPWLVARLALAIGYRAKALETDRDYRRLLHLYAEATKPKRQTRLQRERATIIAADAAYRRKHPKASQSARAKHIAQRTNVRSKVRSITKVLAATDEAETWRKKAAAVEAAARGWLAAWESAVGKRWPQARDWLIPPQR